VKATRFEFRYRVWIAVAIYGLGFAAPWLIFSAGGPRVSTTWLELAGALAGTHALTLQWATLLVTSLAILLAATGAGASLCSKTALDAGDCGGDLCCGIDGLLCRPGVALQRAFADASASCLFWSFAGGTSADDQ
jgi:hypothetical protein